MDRRIATVVNDMEDASLGRHHRCLCLSSNPDCRDSGVVSKTSRVLSPSVSVPIWVVVVSKTSKVWGLLPGSV